MNPPGTPPASVDPRNRLEAAIARLERQLAYEIADGCYGGDLRGEIDLLRYQLRTGEAW